MLNVDQSKQFKHHVDWLERLIAKLTPNVDLSRQFECHIGRSEKVDRQVDLPKQIHMCEKVDMFS